jgi:predicted 2-oxoglutarate/Fe(II)-dependent dioxygenase YbiX
MTPNVTASDELIGRLERDADALRAAGDLDAAAAVCDRIVSIAPDSLKADRLLASLTGRPSVLTAQPGGLKPAPFVLVPDFLPPDAHDALLASVLSNLDAFRPAETTRGLRTDYRRSRMLARAFSTVHEDVKRAFYERLLLEWAVAQPRLKVPAFEPALSEAHGLLYGDGDFFRTHRDTGPNNTRRVTFVYTLFRSPRRFGGGDLLLYDTFFWPGVSDPPAWVPAYADTFTRLAPEDNRLVFFPSEFYHEVTPVTGVGDDSSWGRVAINGWLDTTPELGALAHLSRTPY